MTTKDTSIKRRLVFVVKPLSQSVEVNNASYQVAESFKLCDSPALLCSEVKEILVLSIHHGEIQARFKKMCREHYVPTRNRIRQQPTILEVVLRTIFPV